MTTEKFANSAKTFLAATLQPTDLTLSVTSVTNFPTTPEFRIRIAEELLIVTGVAGSTWTVTRGAEGTYPAKHPQNSPVTAVLTSGALQELRTEIEAEIVSAAPPTNQPSIIALAAASGYSVGQSVWVTASAIFTSGASFTAVPLDKYPLMGEYVFNGQGVQWVELSTFMRLQAGPGIAL